MSADCVSFNAPFKHHPKIGKFVWFNKIEQNNRKDAINEEYLFSLQYIKEKIRQLSCKLCIGLSFLRPLMSSFSFFMRIINDMLHFLSPFLSVINR